jgi:hypothetical protein
MSGKSIISSLLLFISWFVMSSQEETIYCRNFNFNQKVISGINKCKNNAGEFEIKSYEFWEQFTPFTNTSEYYLSPTREGQICGETSDIFTLNRSSEIVLTYNWGYTEGAQLGIKLLNLDALKAVENYVIPQGTDGLWNTYKISVPKEIKRAKVCYVGYKIFSCATYVGER